MANDPKHALRRSLASRLRAAEPDLRQSVSDEVCATVRTLPEWRSARVVAVYAAMPEEVDLSALRAHAGARRLVYPRMVAGDRVLAFHRVPDASALAPVSYGVLEPVADPATRVPLRTIDLFLVPGLAFDPSGGRLGRGKGYYDATLSAAGPRASRLAVAFPWQMVDEVPMDAGDVPMDVIVAGAEVHRPGAARATGSEA